MTPVVKRGGVVNSKEEKKKVKKKRVIQIQTCFASVKLSLSIDIPRRSQIERNRNAEEIGGETAVK